mmetsp:Transcript_16986/g.47431  ORF Transcript_16986/g.47431 Transcript_16986/m.47431 type:complete len:231 (-) Transcript_16986:199-891(-)
MNLHPKSFDVVCTVCPSGEVGKVELDLVPALVQPHGHRANEGLHTGGRLVVGCAEPAAHVLVVQNLYLKSEVFLQVLNDHDQERQFDAQGLAGIRGAHNITVADVCAHDLQHARLDVGVCDALQVTVPHLLLPYLQWLRADTVEDGQEARLEAVLEHGVTLLNICRAAITEAETPAVLARSLPRVTTGYHQLKFPLLLEDAGEALNGGDSLGGQGEALPWRGSRSNRLQK